MMAVGATGAAWETRMAWKPDGYTSVAPYLVVDGAQCTIDFLVAVFDAQPLRMHPVGDRLGHAEVRID
jgi:hypothetical protein